MTPETPETPALAPMRAEAYPAALAAPRRAQGPHFVIQHARRQPKAELSTDSAPKQTKAVDDRGGWGCVVPKRHARRAVTRNLIRRQLRAAMHRHAARLDQGLWLLRLRAGFDAQRYVSAASPALRAAVRTEIDRLLVQAGSAR